jgi:hypothetical protein
MIVWESFLCPEISEEKGEILSKCRQGTVKLKKEMSLWNFKSTFSVASVISDVGRGSVSNSRSAFNV